MVKSKLKPALPSLLILTIWYLPFHGLITAVANNYSGSVYFSGVPHLVVFSVALSVLFFSSEKDRQIMKNLAKRPHNILALSLIGLYLLSYFISSPPASAAIRGFFFNGVFIVGFMLAQFFAAQDRKWLDKLIKGLKPIVAVVIAITLLEVFSPGLRQLLAGIGYKFQTVDLNDDYTRVSGTLRGPNILGTFLVIGLFLYVGTAWNKVKTTISKNWDILLLGLIAIFFSYSRSAVLSLVIAVLVWVWLEKEKILGLMPKKYYTAVLAVGVTGLIAGGVMIKDTTAFQQIVLHRNPSEQSEYNSDNLRLKDWDEAFTNISARPLGSGLGTSGPASFDESVDTDITENYYLQIMQEAGILGGLVFIVLTIMIIWQMAKSKSAFKHAAIPSFAGLAFAGLFSHVWTDVTLAVISWCMAGAILHSVSKKQPLHAKIAP